MQHQQSNTRQNFAVLKVHGVRAAFYIFTALAFRRKQHELTKVLPPSEIRPKENETAGPIIAFIHIENPVKLMCLQPGLNRFKAKSNVLRDSVPQIRARTREGTAAHQFAAYPRDEQRLVGGPK